MITSIKEFFSNTKVQFCVLITVIIFCIIQINYHRSNIKYIDEPCPVCYSNEVLDFGVDNTTGLTHGHCPDCGCDFYVNY